MNISTTTDPGQPFAVVNWTEPVFTDNADMVVNASSTSTPNSEFGIGPTTVNYTGTDSSGNSATCVFVVTVTDNESPEVSGCPSDQSVDTDPGQATAVVIWTEPMVTDNLWSFTLTSTNSSGASFPIGTTTVTYTAEDGSNNVNSNCSFTITVTDNEDPEVSGCPSDQFVNTDPGQATANVTWTEPTATDNSGSATLTSTESSGTNFPIGITNVTYTAQDSSNNVNSSCIFTITITDNEDPEVSGCPSDQSVDTDPGQATAVVNWTEPMVTDNLWSFTLTSTNSSGVSFPIGTTTVTYTAEDGSNNVNSNCSFTITVTGNEDPEVSGCPSDQFVNTDPEQATANVTWTEPTATDNSGSATLTSTESSDTNFPIGMTNVTYTAQDSSNNIDNEAPDISGCPIDQSVGTDPGQATAVVTWTEPTATDNAGPATLASTHSSGQVFALGTTPVVYTATDSYNNSYSGCTFNITVTDDEKPTFSGCPQNITTRTDPGKTSVSLTWNDPVASDNVGVVDVTTNRVSGEAFAIGTAQVVYEASDAAGNVGECIFYIVVLDTELPIIGDCPIDRNVFTDSGVATADVFWIPATAIDNSGLVTLVASHEPGNAFPIGTTTVSYEAMDRSGNMISSCSFDVVVADNENPIIIGCPEDEYETALVGSTSDMVTWTPPTASDNSGNVTLTSSHEPGETFPLGSTTVTYTAVDPEGQTATCSFDVFVTECGDSILLESLDGYIESPGYPDGYANNLDCSWVIKTLPGYTLTVAFTDAWIEYQYRYDVPPSITGCPTDREVVLAPGERRAAVTWTPPSSSDETGAVTMTSSHDPGNLFDIGSTNVTYTSADTAGNTATCTFTAAVIDNEHPVIRGCPADLYVNDDGNGNVTKTVTWSEPAAYDNSGYVNLTSTSMSGDAFPVGGTTSVTYTAVDQSGNEELCTFDVTVLAAEEVTMLSAATGSVDTPNYPGSYPPSLDFFWVIVAGPENTVEFTFTFMDIEGQTNCEYDYVRIIDGPNTTNSILVTLCNTNYLSEGSVYTTTQDYMRIEFHSDSDIQGTGFSGFYSIIDTTPPIINSCPPDQTANTFPAKAVQSVVWTEPTASDNSIVVELTSTADSGDAFPIGTTTVVYTASDQGGNTDSCSFNVTVIDNENPVLNGCPADQNLETDLGSAGAVACWAVPTTSDNSGSVSLTSTAESGAFFPIGRTLVTYTATDPSGNTAPIVCSFNITVTDTEPPTFSSCPTQQTFTPNPPVTSATVSWSPPVASDNSGIVNVTSTHIPGATFEIGNPETVTYTATDEAGYTVTCEFDVILYECGEVTLNASSGYFETINYPSDYPTYAVCSWIITAPAGETVTLQFPDFLLEGSSTCSYDRVTIYDGPTESDPELQRLCGAVYPTSTFTSSQEVMRIKFTSDFSVTRRGFQAYYVISESENPTFDSCPGQRSVSTEVGKGTARVRWRAPIASDNSGTVTVTSNYDIGYSFPLGTTTVTYTAEDPAGNTETCTFDVVVSDPEPPSFIGCPGDIGEIVSGVDTATVSWTPPVASDNSGSVTVTTTHDPGQTFPLGTTDVTYTAVDMAGNVNECAFSVVVYDCSGILILDRSGYIQTPNYPREYLNNVDCSWVIRGLPGEIVDFSFLNFTLESQSICAFDSVRLLDGQNADSPAIAKLCGDDSVVAGMTYTTTQEFLRIEFRSDQSYRYLGFRANFQIRDTESPSFYRCPNDRYVNTDLDSPNAIVTWLPVTASDNSGTVNITSTADSGDAFPIGNTTVTYTATDPSDNTATCTFYIIVSDVQPPDLSGCSGNLSVSTDMGNDTATVTWMPPTASDNSGSASLLSTYDPGDAFPIGSTDVNYTAVDGSGNTFTCIFTISVFDTENPSFDFCPGLQASNTTAVFWTEPMAVDNSGQVNVTSDYSPGDNFTVGSTVVTYTATDPYGNTETCSFTVDVADLEIPAIFGCPGDQSSSTPPGKDSASVLWMEPTATDNSGYVVLSSTHQPGQGFPIGQTNVTYTATDDSGNVVNCIFGVLVEDLEAPEISNCPIDQTVSASRDSPGAVVCWVPPAATDNAPAMVALTLSQSSGTLFPIGTTTVTYTAEDGSGNTNSSCSFDITVIDNTSPVIICPVEETATLVPGASSGAVSWALPVSDNSGNYTLTSTHNSGDTFNLGRTSVNYTAEDAAGNTAICTFDVIVRECGLNELTGFSGYFETINYPNNYPNSYDCSWIIRAPAGRIVTVTFISFYLEDLYGCGYDYINVYNGDSTSDIALGRSICGPNDGLTYTSSQENLRIDMFTDGSITEPGFLAFYYYNEKEAPTFTGCPSSMSISVDPCGIAVASWTEPSASDNSGRVTVTSTHSPPAEIPLGTTTVTYTATDAASNTAECSFNVTVTDMEDPRIDGCPLDRAANVQPPGAKRAAGVWTPPTATDNSGTVSLYSNYDPGDMFLVGSRDVIYTANDTSDNIATCSFQFVVTDCVEVSLTGNGYIESPLYPNSYPSYSDCSWIIAAMPNSTVKFTVVDLHLEYQASCAFDYLRLIDGPNSDDEEIIKLCGSTTPTDSYFSSQQYMRVEFHADSSLTDIGFRGNYSTADLDPPTFSGCPGFQFGILPNTSADVNVTWTPPTASDIQGPVSLTSSNNPGDPFGAGTTNVTYTATDTSGNIATCSFSVIVYDLTAPVITGCPANISVNTDSGVNSTMVSWTPPMATDNSELPVTLTSDYDPGDTFYLGDEGVIVTYTATDAADNEDFCMFLVTVEDAEAPVIVNCPSNQTVFNDPGSASAVVTWTEPDITDNSGMVTSVSTFNPGQAIPIGSNTVTYTARDEAANVETCSFTVLVIDNEDPNIIDCPSTQNFDTDIDRDTGIANWTVPTATDNSGFVTLTSTVESGEALPIGTTPVTYTAVDPSGNSRECSFDVIITDVQDPTITECPGNQEAVLGPGAATATVDWAPPTASDNSGSANLSSTHDPGEAFPAGDTTVTYTAIDPSSNSVSSCSFVISVDDMEKPVINNCPSNKYDTALPGSSSDSVTWTEPTASDNSGMVTLTSTHEPGASFPIGSTTVTYTATDVGGNTAMCSFNVNVLECGSSVVLESLMGYIESPLHPDEYPLSITCSWVIKVPPGNTIEVTFPFFDLEYHSSCSWDSIRIVDGETPADVQVAKLCGSSVSPETIYRSTQESLRIEFVSDFLVRDPGFVLFYDIAETVPPTISDCPGDQVVDTAYRSLGATVEWTPPTATDNVGAATLSSTRDPGDFFYIGETEVNYTAVDSAGNIAVCTFSVIVEDNEDPIIYYCPITGYLNTEEGKDTVRVYWYTPYVFDNSRRSVSVNTTNNPGDTFPIGINTVTYTATDESGNVATCTFDVVVEDCTNITLGGLSGTISSPNYPISYQNYRRCWWIIRTTPGNTISFTFQDVDIEYNYYCSWDWVQLLDGPEASDSRIVRLCGDPSSPGSVAYTSTANSLRVEFRADFIFSNYPGFQGSYTINDFTKPEFQNCPGTQEASAEYSTVAVSWPAPTATDDISNVTLNSTHEPGQSFPIGTTNVTYTATDSSGNEETCSFQVVVTDIGAPVIAPCPGDFSVLTDKGSPVANVSWPVPSITDNAGEEGLMVNISLTPPYTFGPGLHTVTYYAEDAVGLSTTCAFNITVEGRQTCEFSCCVFNGASCDTGSCLCNDNCVALGNCCPDFSGVCLGPPMLLCPNDIQVSANATSPITYVNLPPAVITSQPNIANLSITVVPSKYFGIGVNRAVFVAMDDFGNEVNCTTVVTVVDDTSPVFEQCPENITVSTPADSATLRVNWTVSATDNSRNVTTTRSTNPNSVFAVGTTRINYVATDPDGNTASCVFFVEVVDDVPPVISQCPNNITLPTEPGSNRVTNVMWTEPTALDNTGAVAIAGTRAPGATFKFGYNTVYYVAIDAYGNEAECVFVVAVIDQEKPTFLYCPPSVAVQTDPGVETAAVEWTRPTAQDNTFAVTVQSALMSGHAFPVGSNAVEYNATDSSGNVETCDFRVNVTDEETPSISNCPPDFSVSADNGVIYTTVSWTVPVFTDNTGNVSVSFSHSSPVVLDVGSHAISYTATDQYGNVAECNFTVKVTDDELPTIACPSNIIDTTDPGLPVATISWSDAVAMDNTGPLNITSDIVSGSNFSVGVTTVTYSTVDPSGNTASCSFTVTISDEELPAISNCPDNITEPALSGEIHAIVEWPALVFTDNSGIVFVTQTHYPNDTFYLGTVEVVYTAVDEVGNENSCKFPVTITDEEPPVFLNCPSDIVMMTDMGVAESVVSWPPVVATDNAGHPMVSSNFNPGQTFSLGPTLVVYDAIDDSGNVANCTFTVTVIDRERPMYMDCPADIVQAADVGSINTTVSWTVPNITDNANSSAVSWISNYSPPVVLDIGFYVVRYTAIDGAGLLSRCIFTITVTDDELPTITCPSNIINTTDPALPVAAISWSDAVATDNTGPLNVTSDIVSGSNFSVGVTTVTYSTVDPSGNSATCSFTVTISDKEAPVIENCPGDIIVNISDMSRSANVSWTPPTITDNTDNLIVVVSTHPGTIFNFGNTTVVYRAQDFEGNAVTCWFVVAIVDQTPPVIRGCPGDVNTTTDLDRPTAVVFFDTPNITDNMGRPSVSLSKRSGTRFAVGDTPVTYTATDVYGNVAVCSFTVTVRDVEPPVIGTLCPFNITVPAEPGLASAVVNWTVPMVTDNTVAVTFTPDKPPGSTFNLGPEVVTYTARDAYGNTAECLINVLVFDDQPPTLLGCPNGTITQSTNMGRNYATVTWSTPLGQDNGGAPTVTSNRDPGNNFPVGNATVTYEATDAAGLSSNCSFVVEVVDTEDPIFSQCPPNIVIILSDTHPVNVTWTEPTSSDNVGVTASPQDAYPYDLFDVGVTPVTYTATDGAGNTARCQFNVSIVDITPPTVTGCPPSMTANLPADSNTTQLSWTEPTATDVSGNVTVSTSHASGSYFGLGVTSVMYVFTDSSGNPSTCSFEVTIRDKIPPVATYCPESFTFETNQPSGGALVNWTEPIFYDNSGSFEILATTTSPAQLAQGPNFIFYLARDGSGNLGSCSFTITVADLIAPTITNCPNDITTITDAGQPTAVVTWTEPIIMDNGGTPTISISKASGSEFGVGVTEVIYTVTDSASLTDRCSFNVTVTDEEMPVFSSCPSVLNVSLPADASVVNASRALTATDNSGSATLTSTLVSLVSPSIMTVTYTAVDPSGNEAQCTVTLRVIDETPPVIDNCPSDVSTPTNSGVMFATISWDAVNVTDNVGIVSIESSAESGTNFMVGETRVTVVATDTSGNEATCEFNITVIDTEPPRFIDCPSDITRTLAVGASRRRVTWSTPIVIDNTISIMMTSNVSSGSLFAAGDTVVAYTATDQSNNEAMCYFTVTIIDSESPEFSNCSTETIVQATNANSAVATVIWSEPTASDNTGTAVVTSNYSPGANFSLGNTTVEYIATDQSGNINTCSFLVTITDEEAPRILDCPMLILSSQDAGKIYATVTWAFDVVDNVEVISDTSLPANGSQFDLGSTPVVYSARDAAGNEQECRFDVVVQDTTAPIIRNCPGVVTATALIGRNFSTVFWTAPTASDPSGPVTGTNTANPLDTFFIGSTTVVYTFTDTFGNTANCSFQANVIDNQDPVITDCPENIDTVPDPGSITANISWTEPTITDNSNEVFVDQNEYPNTLFGLGTVTVVYMARDATGNMAMCSFTVTVTDSVPPVLSGCPGNITTPTDPGNGTAVVTWTEPQATDNTIEPTVTSTEPSGAYFGIGETVVTYTATDTVQLSDSCSFTVTVIDNEAPILPCPDTYQLVGISMSEANVSWTVPMATDNSGMVGLSSNISPGTVLSIGEYVVVYTATDPSGNMVTCNFTLFVNDTIAPTFSNCNTTIVRDTDTGLAFAVVTWNVVATDNFGTPTVQSSFESGSDFGIGTTVVTFDATDTQGNTATCSINITVIDVENPTFSDCPMNITTSTDLNSPLAVVNWTEAVAADNSGMVSQMVDVPSGSSFPIGLAEVTYTATDGSGNSAVCTFFVAVTDDQAPVFTNCDIGSINQTTSPGAAVATVTWTVPQATDNVGAPTVTSEYNPLDTFPPGETTVVYTARDSAGNEANCSFVIRITDQEPPSFSNLPTSQTVVLPSTDDCISVSWTEPTITDNVALNFTSSTYESGASFCYGNTTVRYLAEDIYGNWATHEFTVEVQDVTPPVFAGCPTAPIMLLTSTYTPGVDAVFTPPNATDNVGTRPITSTHGPSDSFPIGTTTVTYTVKDFAGLTSSCTFDVIVNDNEDPVLSNCPADITAEVDASSATVNVSWTAPSANDNTGNVGLQTSHAPYSIFSIGTTNVTYTATDGSGNTDSCTFSVIVLDNIPPVLQCSPNEFLTTDPGQAIASNISAVVTATDNSGTPLVSSNLPADEAGVGVSQVTVTAQDGSGNMVSCNFNITVTDDEAPAYPGCPSDLYLYTTNVAAWTVPTPVDNTMVIAASSASHEPGVFPPGTTVVSYNATDQYGNVGSCVFSVTVNNTDSPMVSNCPSDITVNSSLVSFDAMVEWTEPTVMDTDMVNLNQSHSPGDTFPIGTTEVTYVYVDTTGRSTTCAFNVIVLLVQDETPPVFDTCPANFTTYTEVGNTSAVVTWPEPTASDNTGLPVTYTSNYQNGAILPLGFTTVLYVATDTLNNNATCEFAVQVLEDFAPEFVNCSSDIVVGTDPGLPNATVSWMEPVASDANGPVTTTNNHSPGSVFPLGDTAVVYEATDGTGNTVACAFDVTVEDRESPVFIFCPSSVTIFIPAGETTTVSWSEPTATDNVGVFSIDGTSTSGSSFGLGSYLVVYSALDDASNAALCTFNINVLEDVEPTFVDCPMDITVSNDVGLDTAIVSWTEPTATDDRDNVTVAVASDTPGTAFPLGTTEVNYTATDSSGNVAVCSFTVAVEDDESPVISDCPSSITRYTISTRAIVTWTPPSATDNDVLVSLTSNIQPGAQFAIGSHDIIYTAVDASSNTKRCTFTITVIADNPPTISGCPADINQNTDPGNATAVVTWTEPSASDDRENITLTSDSDPGVSFGIGTSTVTYTATDSAGQTVTCLFDVTINDNEDPVLTDCPMGIEATISPNVATMPVTWPAPSASDNSGTVTVTSTYSPGVQLAQGFHVNIYVAVDAAGNSVVCSFLITITEDQPPVVSDCPGDQTVSTDPGQDYASSSWTEPTATDDTGNVTVSVMPDITQYPLGTTAVTYTFTDSVNLTSTCSFLVTVQDTEDPVISGCPNDTSLTLPSSQLPVSVSWTAPTATDNTDNVTLDGNIESGTAFPEGTHEISYTASDQYGNNAVCTFDVIVTVDAPPTFTSCPSDVTASSDPGVNRTAVSWAPAAATDDYGNVTLSSDYESGANFTIGATVVTITATDSAGSQTTCSFTVTVEDQEDPVLVDCPVDVTAYVYSSSDTAILTWTVPTVMDNSGESITPSSNRQSGESFGQGSSVVLYSAVDSSGNVATCSFVIIVQVVTNPTEIDAHLRLNRIRDQVGAFSETDVTNSETNLAIDLETLFRQSALSGDFAGLQITASNADPTDNLNAEFTMVLYFTSSASITESDVEGAFDASTTDNVFDINNELPSVNDFYAGTGPCSTSPCLNSGVCSAIDRVSFECACPSTYMGTLCENDVNECDNNPCSTNQVCMNTVGGFQCDCSAGFTNQNDICVQVASQLGGSFDISAIDGAPAVFTDDLDDETSAEYRRVSTIVTDEKYISVVWLLHLLEMRMD
ncbi:uncharacterized protein [Diadema setosum]|uniref:uncharacterized protein n=1 Tax=Diadema setosum TaxID=31175 RepID=UPI003B3A8002